MLDRLRSGVKAAAQLVLRWTGRVAWGSWSPGGTRYDYAGTTGDGRANAAVHACIRWAQRTVPEAPPLVQTLTRDGWQPAPDHPLAVLLRRPNPAYSWLHLEGALVADLMATGNAYLVKAVSGSGRPLELWWVPSTQIEPRWPEDGSAYISHYDWTVDNQTTRLDPRQLIHVRQGFDPKNIRKGLSDLAMLAREIATDDAAANWTASLLRNAATPTVVIAPKSGTTISPADAEQIKATYVQRFGGDNLGAPLVTSAEVSVTTLSWSPQQMNVRELRRVPEERITAALGIPAIVVGLGAGIDRSTFANFAEAREAAYESFVIPVQRLVLAEFNTQLVPDFGDPARLRMEFDLSQVRVLQQDENELHQRARDDLRAGGITLNEFRTAVGMEVDPDGDVYYLPINVTPTEPSELLAPPSAVTVSPPGKVLALTGGRKHAKAAADVSGSIARLRARLQTRTERQVAAFLAKQADRVAERLSRGGKAAKVALDPADLLPDDETGLLRQVLDPAYLATLDATHGLVEDALGVTFQLDDPLIRQYLGEAGQLITSITDTTRAAVADALVAGQAEGESLAQLAQRLRALPQFDRQRATLVARTELGRASNLSSLYAYEGTGGVVVGIEVRDGDTDAACAAMNGRRFGLADARGVAPLQHPNCVRALLPLTDAADLAGAA